MKEVWKDVVGYEGLYQVSNLGRVKSLDRLVWGGRVYYKVKSKLLKQRIDHKGYWRVALCRNSKHKYPRPHRLVAEAFILNPENKPTVNHINNIRTDNRLENLEWATYKEQTRHGIERGNINYPIYEHEKDIIRDYKNGISQKAISKKYNISCMVGIANILKNNGVKIRKRDKMDKTIKMLIEGKSLEYVANKMGIKVQTLMQYRSKYRKKGIKC